MPGPESPRFRRSPRRWVVPPGLSAADEPFEGYTVLAEIRDGLGVVLWQSLRDLDLWSTSPPEARRALLTPGVVQRRKAWLASVLEPGSPLLAPLRLLSRAVEGRARVGADDVVDACHAVSKWAAGHGHSRTATAFAQSAAFAAPDRASAAYEVALLARRGAEYRRAETWFRRALGLARRTGDWKHYGLACVGLGNLFLQRGDYPTARGWFNRSLRVARRHGLWHVRPMALHDLFCMAAKAGQLQEAEMYARRAFRAYGRRHPRLVALAHDVGRFWMLKGDYARALKVLRAVLPHIERKAERRVANSNIALAAAGLGDRFVFAAMWSEVWREIGERDDTEGVPNALLNLARGAAALGDRERAQLAATHALRSAIQRREAEVRLAAESLLEGLRGPRLSLGSGPDRPYGEASADALVTDLVDALMDEPAEPV
ncbi:MAG TPA: tetratricopeptide repeat protein [Longimicrobium sp.]|nr:tetratricopeptide repeat protein [Longimicrobium sp.]